MEAARGRRSGGALAEHCALTVESKLVTFSMQNILREKNLLGW
jgi:hypothetical protein